MTKALLTILLLFMVQMYGTEIFSFEEITILYEIKDKKIAQQLAPILYHNLVRFQKSIGHYTILPVTIQILENGKEPISEQKIIEFSDAFYNPETQIIFIRNPKLASRYSRLQEIMLHEYIHHFIFHHFPQAPLWFHEGMAVYFSEGITYQRKLHFVKDNILGNSLPLKEMTHQYPKSPIRWQSFYSKSALAIQYMVTQKNESFYRLWENTERTKDFNQAFINSFLMTPEQFYIYFENYANEHFRLELLLASSTIIWAFLPILFFIGLVRRKKQEKEMETHWKEQESYERI
jgi:hypothetical protein